MANESVCKNCGSVMIPKNMAKGKGSTECMLWLLPVILAVPLYIYQTEGGIDKVFAFATSSYLAYQLFGFWWFIAFIYSLWRFFSKRPVCTKCGAEKCFIPVDTPEGQKKIKEQGITNSSSSSTSQMNPSNLKTSTNEQQQPNTTQKSTDGNMSNVYYYILIAIPVLVIIFIGVPAIDKINELKNRNICRENLLQLGKAMLMYSNDNRNDAFPTADKWCNLLSKYCEIDKLRCPNINEGEFNYAINSAELSATSPYDMVMIFETDKTGWNLSGGRQLFSKNTHRGKGCHVLFADLHVEFVKDPNKLRWTADTSKIFERSESDTENEIEFYKQAIKLNPDDAEPYKKLGIIYGKLDRWNDAAESYEQVIRINPRDSKAHSNLSISCYNIGVSYGKMGHWADAIKAYNQAIEINPDFAACHVNLGVAYHKIGLYQNAVESYKKANKINPNDANVYLALGVEYVMLTDKSSATQEYNVLKLLNPELAVQLLNLINMMDN
jgi:prepilin-type processing-associated H-X9-DG protein